MFSPTDLHFTPSRLGHCWRWLVVALALLAVLLTALPLFTRIVLALLVLGYGLCGPLFTSAITRLQWQPRLGTMRVSEGADWLDVESMEAIMQTRWVIFMRLQLRQRYLPVGLLVWPDMLTADDYRRFSVAVRFGKPPQFASADPLAGD